MGYTIYFKLFQNFLRFSTKSDKNIIYLNGFHRFIRRHFAETRIFFKPIFQKHSWSSAWHQALPSNPFTTYEILSLFTTHSFSWAVKELFAINVLVFVHNKTFRHIVWTKPCWCSNFSNTSVKPGSLTTKCWVVSGFFQQTSQIRKINTIVEKETIDVNDKLRSVWKEAYVDRRFFGRNDESLEIIISRYRWKEGEVFI